MIALDWLHAVLAVAVALAPVVYNRLTGGTADAALAKLPVLNFLVKTLAARASLSPQESSVVSQALGETHPTIPPEVLALQLAGADAAKK